LFNPQTRERAYNEDEGERLLASRLLFHLFRKTSAPSVLVTVHESRTSFAPGDLQWRTDIMRTKIHVLATIIAAAGIGTANAQTAPPTATSPTETVQQAAGPDRSEASLGETIYLRYCAACHGRSLKGDGPVAPGLVKKPIDLTALSARFGGTFPYDRVSSMIDGRQTTRMHGTPDMPVWGEIFAITAGTDAPTAESAVKRIAHYIWSNQAKPKERAPKK
jgi:mono/diheme cytochrome c family protein